MQDRRAGPRADGGPGTDRPRYSVVVPTHQRRDVVTAAVRALAAVDYPHPFETVVVVDGGTDGTADALRSLSVPFPLTVVEQPHLGAARARNEGARRARGQRLLFLDDDMLVAPDLLRAHDAAYAAGADAVMGHVPLHPASPGNFLSRGVGEWAEDRRARLVETAGDLTFTDLLTGQLSVPRELFWRLGGFDEAFTRGGSFGGEDTDFGRRLLDDGHRLVFAPDAVSWQYYAVQPSRYLQQWHQAGCADVVYVRKHPDQVDRVYRARRPHERWNRLVWRPLARAPVLSAPVAFLARQAVLVLTARRPDADASRRWFFRVRNLEYWRGVHAAGGLPRRGRRLRVLCYHSVADLAGVPVLERYGVPADLLRAQLRALRRAGAAFVSFDEVLRYLRGEGGLPRRPVLVTFDDAYVDLLEQGVPVLREQGVPALAFAVTGLLGQTNAWDEAIGAPALPLLDAPGLRALVAAGVEVGVHGCTHRSLDGLSAPALEAETTGAARRLVELGLPAPRAFSYPYGEHDGPSRAAVAGAGLPVAFTVEPGAVRPARCDPLALPRVEVLRGDGAGLRFLLKVASGGRRR